jgi:cytidylate kinase
MATIAIARELGALGEELAAELGRSTGFKIIDRDHLESRLAALGLNPEKHQKYDERKPGLWASLSQERDDYLHYLKLTLYEEAAEGSCIMLGRGAGAILKSMPNLASIRVTAPIADRISRIRKSFACDERHALQLIEQSDHDRSGFHKYFFSIDWHDPRNYGLVLNMGDFSLEDAAKIVDDYRRIVSSEERERAGKIRAKELLLGQRVVTEIVYVRKIPIHFLEAEARGGRVTLHGVANTEGVIEEALAAARSVPGVEETESTIQVVQEFTVMP